MRLCGRVSYLQFMLGCQLFSAGASKFFFQSIDPTFGNLLSILFNNDSGKKLSIVTCGNGWLESMSRYLIAKLFVST